MNILLIEDDAGLVELITSNLDELGFYVMSVSSGIEALAHLEKQTPDLMLLDYSLPDISGKELIETLIKQQTPPPPFIITTGQGNERIAVDMMKLGAMDYLVKDILFLEKLPDVVKRVVKEIESEGKLKQVEEALKESEDRFRKLSENAPVLINSFDEDGRCLFWNKQCNKTFGWTIEEINEQEGTMALFYPDPAMREEVIRTITTDPDGNFREWHPVTKEGKILSMMWANFRLPDGQVFSMGHDITTQKQIEDALKKKTHDIGERIKELKCLYAISSLFENQNISMEKFFQSIVNFIPPSWQYPEITCAQIIFNDNQYKTDNFESSNWKQHSDIMISGKHIGTVEVHYLKEMPLLDEGPFLKEERNLIDEIAEWSTRFIERKEAEGKSKKLETQLQQAQKMESIGTLAGGIAHDFNNILTSVIGFSDIALNNVSKGSELEDDLNEIYTAGMRAKELVNQILTFARQSDEENFPIRIDSVAKEVIKFIRSSIPTSIEIKSNINSKSNILGNQTQVHQIFMNLFTNAAYAMEEDGGILDVNLEDIRLDIQEISKYPNLQSGVYIKITVSDTGKGIPQNIIDSIFEPYFTTKDIGEGTGLGLAMVQGIIDSYGGQINVSSQLGKGSIFTIYLPVTEKNKKNVIRESVDLHRGTEKILLVDDEAVIIKLNKRILEGLGYLVTTRTSSMEAFDLFKSKPEDFDLVITDMTMPVMNGDKLAKAMVDIRPNIPILLCTGYSKKLSVSPLKEYKIKALLKKPINQNELAKTIRKVLDEARITNG